MANKNLTMEECILSRRSVRVFTEQKPPFEDVRQLVKYAAMAPSGSNIQPWEFIVIDDAETLKNLKNFTPGINGNPPYVIVICSDKKQAFEKGGILGRDVLSVMDISMAAENLMLAATAMGMGTCAIKSFRDTLVTKILNLPEHIYPELIITVGYPARESSAPKKKAVEDILHHNKWGGACND